VVAVDVNGVTDTCEAPFVVNFNNKTLNQTANTSYSWDFGDGNSSTQINPSHTYTSRGSFDVELIASNGFCSDTLRIQDFININDPQADFVTSVDTNAISEDTFCLGQTVFFFNQTSIGNRFNWDFGDGNTSTLENPTHVYNDSGWVQVSLITSSNNACRDTIVKDIYIEQAVAKFSSSPKFTCSLPDTISFFDSSTNAVKWSWILGGEGGSTVLSGKNPSFIQKSKGKFSDTLIVTSRAGCTDQFVIADNREAAGPDIFIKPDSSIGGCFPMSYDFSDSIVSSNPVFTRHWDFDNGDTSNLANPPTQTYNQAGDFEVTLTITDSSGCVNSAKKTFKMGKVTKPIIFLDEDTLCFKDTLILREISGDRDIESWDWKITKGEQELTLGNRPFVRVTNLPDTGHFTVEVKTSNNGCDTTVSIDSAFFVSGPIANPFAIIDSCGSRSFSFFSNVSDDADEFLWDFGDSTIVTGVADTQHVYNSDGNFKVRYEFRNSATGCEVKGSFSVKASIINTGITPKDTIGCPPFAVELQGPPNSSSISSEWFIHDTVLVSRNRDLIDTLREPGVFTYKLMLRNSSGCLDSSFQTIRVLKPEAKMKIEVLNKCVPLEVAFNDQSIYDTTFKSVLWSFSDGQTATSPTDTIGFGIADSTFGVTMFVEDILGCRDTLTFEDTLKTPNKSVDFTALDSGICLGDTLFLVNQSIGDNQTYSWDFGDSSGSNQENPFHVYNSSDSFTVVLSMTDNENCTIVKEKTNFVSVQNFPIAAFTADTLSANCFPLPVNFTDTTASPFVSQWRWDFDDGGKASFQNPSHTFNRPGKFDISLIVTTSNGCSDTLTKTDYIQTSGPIADLTISKDSVCRYEELTFTMINPSNVANVLWDFGDGNTRSGNPVTYSYQSTGTVFPTMILSDSGNTCFISVRDTVFVEDVIADFQIGDTSGCAPFTVSLLNTSNRADSWNWNFGDGAQSGDFNASHTYDSAGVFLIAMNISNQNGCADTAFQEVVVSDVPDISITPDTSICEGDTLLLEASGGDNYQWLPSTFLDRPNEAQTFSVPDQDITYRLLVSNNQGCSAEDSVSINVQPKPEPFVLRDTNLIIGEQVQFNVFSGSNFSYQWTPSTGLSCDDCPDPIAQPLETTIYRVEVRDPLGCFPITDTALVEVKVAFTLELPEAFTPNGDGQNDRIFVRGWGIKELILFQVYNRWGEQLYESSDLNQGWDGKFKGEDQPIGTYVYVVKVLTFQDQLLFKKGNFKLIR